MNCEARKGEVDYNTEKNILTKNSWNSTMRMAKLISVAFYPCLLLFVDFILLASYSDPG